MLVEAGKLPVQPEADLRVTYHDPCHLGRQGEPYVPWQGKEKKVLGQVVVYEPRKPRYNGACGVYNPPRDILKSIPALELVEMERIREYSWCCGAGAGVKQCLDDFAIWTASERIAEAKSVGADAIITACPWCERNFKDAIAASGDNISVYDVVELLKRAM